MIDSLDGDAVSRRRIMRCWPTGKPTVWEGWSREKVNILVSEETSRLEESVALDQVLGWRNIAPGDCGWSKEEISADFKRARDEESSVPMW